MTSCWTRRARRGSSLLLVLAFFLAPACIAGTSSGPSEDESRTAGSAAVADGVPRFDAAIVVTGSRSREELRRSPMAVTVVSQTQLAESPADNYADALRLVPGLNTIQISARDVNLTPRGASGRNARSTLVLVDGRSVYQDYFGMVLWDLVPVDFDEVDRIEVVRGPNSAMWGANALNGVVNIITRSPSERPGTNVRLRLGELDTFEASVVQAGAGERVSYRVSSSYFTQDPWERPLQLEDGTALPAYRNQGTRRVRVNGTLELRPDEERAWRLSSGLTDGGGILLTGLGPFDATTLRQGYLDLEHERGGLLVRGYVNVDEASYEGLLGSDRVDITSQTYQLEASNRQAMGKSHLLMYGASARAGHFDLSLVPDHHGRNVLGGYLEDEIALSPKLGARVGGRVDWFETFGLTLSPRASLRFSPHQGHTLRVSYNRAYIAPSLVENYLRFHSTAAAPL